MKVASPENVIAQHIEDQLFEDFVVFGIRTNKPGMEGFEVVILAIHGCVLGLDWRRFGGQSFTSTGRFFIVAIPRDLAIYLLHDNDVSILCSFGLELLPLWV